MVRWLGGSTRRRKGDSSSEPKDKRLYESVKARVYSDIPNHSAYRSGILVQKYKDAYRRKHGAGSSAYRGKRKSRRAKGLRRWFAEKWLNQRNEVGYKYKSDVYRPTRRITKNTPITHGELTRKELRRARRMKARKGRVRRFRPLH